jgi:hypothetical protein
MLPVDEQLVDRLRSWADASDATLLLVLDQFEEFLLYHGDSWQPGGAASELAEVLSERNLPANVLIGLREDALASLDRFKGRVPYLFENYLRLEHLEPAAARQAILGPLDVWRKAHPDDPVWAEPGLVETLLDEVTTDRVTLGRRGAGGVARTGRPGVETPFLQLVLTRLWEEERSEGSRQLRVATLRRLGGAADVIRAHLDQRMGRLHKSERDVAAAVFHQLVTPSGAKVARSLGDLSAYTGIPQPEIEAVLQTLSQGEWRIVRAVREPGAGEAGTYEVFHDVLAEAILDWRTRHEEQRRRAQIVRRAMLAVLCAAVVVGVALVVAAVLREQRNDAERERDRAEAASLEARAQRLAAESQLQIGVDQQAALEKARAAVEARSTSPQAVQALRGALAHASLRSTLRGAEGLPLAIRLSLDGRRLVQLGADHRLRVWRLPGGVPMPAFRTAIACWRSATAAAVCGRSTAARLGPCGRSRSATPSGATAGRCSPRRTAPGRSMSAMPTGAGSAGCPVAGRSAGSPSASTAGASSRSARMAP